MKPLRIHGLHGMGDNVHIRSIVRQFMDRRDVYLETPWPCLFGDLKVKCVTKGSELRTQAKNAIRESDRYYKGEVPPNMEAIRVTYTPWGVRKYGSVLAAMSNHCGVSVGDFSLPIPAEWTNRAQQLVSTWNATKPLLIYRPLVERTEWTGCANRNPDHRAYAELLSSIREQFFVVSVADTEPAREWIVGNDVKADVEFHKGELDIEILAGLFGLASLAFTSPGFAVVLGQATHTPVVVVLGGYESGRSFSAGAAMTPTLAIEPIEPCECWSHSHPCKKAIDMGSALTRLKAFADEHHTRKT